MINKKATINTVKADLSTIYFFGMQNAILDRLTVSITGFGRIMVQRLTIYPRDSYASYYFSASQAVNSITAHLLMIDFIIYLLPGIYINEIIVAVTSIVYRITRGAVANYNKKYRKKPTQELCQLYLVDCV